MLVFVQSMCNPCVLSQPASMCWTVLDHTFTQPVTQVLLTVVHSCAACITASVSLYHHRSGSPDLWCTQVFSSFFLSIITSSSNSTLSLLSLCHHAVSLCIFFQQAQVKTHHLRHSLTTLSRYSICIRASYSTGHYKVVTNHNFG